MHKPFKKIHQNIRGWKWCTIQNSRGDMTDKEGRHGMRGATVSCFALLILHILQCIWQINKKRDPPSVTTTHLYTSQMTETQTNTMLSVHTHMKLTRPSGILYGLPFFALKMSVVAETLLQTFISPITMIFDIWRLKRELTDSSVILNHYAHHWLLMTIFSVTLLSMDPIHCSYVKVSVEGALEPYMDITSAINDLIPWVKDIGLGWISVETKHLCQANTNWKRTLLSNTNFHT